MHSFPLLVAKVDNNLMHLNYHLVVFGLFELASTLILGLVAIYFVYRRIEKMLGVCIQDEIEAKNYAVSLFAGIYAFCLLWLSAESVNPSVDALRTMVQVQDVLELKMLLIAAGYSIGLFLVSVVVGSFLLATTIKVLTAVTKKLDELSEIKAGNIATALFIGLSILATTIIARPALASLLDGLVSYDYLDKIGKEATQKGTAITPVPEETVE